MLIGINGYSRAGKDQIAQFLVQGYGFRRWAFADGLRKVLLDILHEVHPNLEDYIVENGWDAAKAPYPEVVGGMIALGAGMRRIDPDIWVKAMPGWVIDENDNDVVIPDLRHVNEFEAVLQAGGQVWKVHRLEPSNNGINVIAGERFLKCLELFHLNIRLVHFLPPIF